MNRWQTGRGIAATALSVALISSGSAIAAGGGGGGGGADTGSLYSDLILALRAEDGTPVLKEYHVDTDDDAVPDTYEYCVQPVSYERVPGIAKSESPLDGRDVWVIPLQGEWLGSTEPLPVEEIEACDPQPQYAMFVSETELERLNLTRTSESVLAKKAKDVKTKLTVADEISLDPAGRLVADGLVLDAAPEYASIYESLMTTGTIPGLPDSMAGPPASVPAGSADPYDAYKLAAVALGAAASKTVPINVDTVQYYNRVVGFTGSDSLPEWTGMYPFISSEDPDTSTAMPTDALPGGERFVDYSDFRYNRSQTFVGSVTWLDVAALRWKVTPILDAVPFSDITADPVGTRTLHGLVGFAQMADDARSVISYLHEHDVVLPGFFMDPVGVDTRAAQLKATTDPAVDFSSIPPRVFQTMPFQMTASLFNPWGGTAIDTARVRIRIDAGADPLAVGDVTAVSTEGPAVDFTADSGDLVGWWGPEAGFPVDPGYHASSTFEVTVGDSAPAGDYQVSLELVDVDAPAAVLAEDQAAVGVEPDALAVLWGGEVAPMATQEVYLPLSVRAYSSDATSGELTFRLTAPDDDPVTPVVEELGVGDVTVYGVYDDHMAAMPLSLAPSGNAVTGTWPADLNEGFTDIVWYLKLDATAPIGQYVVNLGISGGSDLAEPAYFTLVAAETHSQQPPGVGEDTTAPVVTLSLDGISEGVASFTVGVSEETSTLQARLTSSGVAGDWQDIVAGGLTYQDLSAGNHVVSVRAVDLAGNTATYALSFSASQSETAKHVDVNLTARNNAVGNDVIRVNAPSKAAGAVIKVFKVRRDGSLARPALVKGIANEKGNLWTVIKDPRKGITRTFVAKLGGTYYTLVSWSPETSIR